MVRKELQVGHKVLLYKSCLRRLLGRLNSRAYGPYIVNKVNTGGLVEVKDPKDSRVFTLKGRRWKVYSGGEKASEKVSLMLSES